MTPLSQGTLVPVLLLCCLAVSSATTLFDTPPNLPLLTDLFKPVPANEAFSVLFGGTNIEFMGNGSYADLSLNKSSGSGMISKNRYYYGFVSAAIKLPGGFTSGVVVAFYLSNADSFPSTHDEIDFELLGHQLEMDWVIQTNIYGNGEVAMGREERFYPWFDPTQAYHNYSIIWNAHHIVFLVDNVPVREVVRGPAIGGAYASKPMRVYSTIWDGSAWATQGGRSPVNYTLAPFVASVGNVEAEGCVLVGNHTGGAVGPCSPAGVSGPDPIQGDGFAQLSTQQAAGLQWARSKFLFYSYCNDTARFKVPPPECAAGN